MAAKKKQAVAGPWWDAWRGVVFANARVLQAVEPSLEKSFGISLPFLDVLSRLYDEPNHRLRMQELAEQSLFTRSGMTRLVDRVEKAGFVRRESVPGDRRGVYVLLTSEGERILERAMSQHQSDIQRVFASRLSPDQHRAVADALAQFWRK
ncbi:MAG TPA: MarR family transcriptional regulator [Dehalococcoidia bacterium]|nr:MarR family transcriptional regulator [Dehalococcoidia bacterium]